MLTQESIYLSLFDPKIIDRSGSCHAWGLLGHVDCLHSGTSSQMVSHM